MAEKLTNVRSIRLTDAQAADVDALAKRSLRKAGQVIQEAIAHGLALMMRERTLVAIEPQDRAALIAACDEIEAEMGPRQPPRWLFTHV